jgi:hypothetical protein
VIAVLLFVGAIPAGTTPWPLILVIGTGVATVLMLIRLIVGAGDEAGFELDRGSGMYVAFIAAAIALAGAVMNYTAAGGSFSDLTDMDKMRDAFKGGDSADQGSPPPPPPPPPAP